MQMATYEKISSFVMNLNYIRPYDETDFNDYKKEDLWCVFYFILFIAITTYFSVFKTAFFYWYGCMVIMSILNTYRALVAHRYQAHLKPELDPQLKQLTDSVTIDSGLLTPIWAPIGLRYHSTHHFLPTLPYYSLATAHKRLKQTLPSDHPYHQTIEKNFTSAFIKLVKSCGN